MICSWDFSTSSQMVLHSLFFLNEDGTLKTYEYHKNTVAMLQWLEGYIPHDIHTLSPINRGELCDPNSDQTIVIAMQEVAMQPPYNQYSDFSQGTMIIQLL